MENKHTPGPWITERTHSVIWIGSKGNRTDGKTERIVTHIDIDSSYKKEVKITREADAKLIAAAPELLDALYEAKDALLWYKEQVGKKPFAVGDAALEEIDNVIKKATE